MKCSWIKKLYDNTTPSWNIIPLYLIKMNLGLNFKFHLNLDISIQKLKMFATYCKIILRDRCLTPSPVLPSAIASLAQWYNKHIKVNNNIISFSKASYKG